MDSYQSNYGEVSAARRWVLVALLFSLGIHGFLILLFHLTPLQQFTVTTERLVPRVFTVNRVQVDPTVLSDTTEKESTAKEENRPPIPVDIPDEKPTAPTTPKEVRISPAVSELTNAISAEKPKADVANLQKMASMEKSASSDIERELNSIQSKLLKENPSATRPTIRVTEQEKQGALGGKATEGSAIPGLASLDDALAGGGKYDPSKPIGIPGGAIFEYDSAELRDAAISSMQKLNRLLTERFPKAIFRIEGHTDSFGSPEYNLALSQRRAESVKNWLVQNYGIAPERLQTKGYGSTRLIVPADKTVEEQAPNRRVEISIVPE